jgi:hypothetical protein
MEKLLENIKCGRVARRINLENKNNVNMSESEHKNCLGYQKVQKSQANKQQC